MKLAKYQRGAGTAQVGMVEGDRLIPLKLNGRYGTLADLLEADTLPALVEELAEPAAAFGLSEATLLPPIDQQEVWAAGVTYTRSKAARMEESEAAASCYDRVYVSPRPELFMKATAHRVAGSDQPLRIRRNAQWNVPEPELTLVLSSRLEIVGYTIGNDMSSRDIEGENPLYLPQAKVYDQCCGLGPWITLAHAMPPRSSVGIQLEIHRGAELVFEGQTGLDQLARTPEELVQWLGRDNSFPNGAFLLTGTGIVPDSSFTLQPRDVVRISIDGIGTLVNSIVQG